MYYVHANAWREVSRKLDAWTGRRAEPRVQPTRHAGAPFVAFGSLVVNVQVGRGLVASIAGAHFPPLIVAVDGPNCLAAH